MVRQHMCKPLASPGQQWGGDLAGARASPMRTLLMRTLADTALATVQAALEPALFAKAFAAGQQMSLAEAFATILAPTPIAAKEGKPITQEGKPIPA